MKRGSIVEIPGKVGQWAVLEPCQGPDGPAWRMIQPSGRGWRAYAAAQADVELLAQPVLEAGQRVTYEGATADVVIDGDVTVGIQFRGGPRGSLEVERGRLVAENIGALLPAMTHPGSSTTASSL